MSPIHVRDTVGELVARHPALSRTFEAIGVDYCCGGKKTLEEACRSKGLDPRELAAELESVAAANEGGPIVDAAAMGLSELADHIQHTHHAYLREALPRLDMLTERVVAAHGAEDPRLREVRSILLEFANEMSSHMMKEELVLFPWVRRLDARDAPPYPHCGSIANPIQRMEQEHHDAGAALARLRELTDGHTPPTWACNTYRAMLDALEHLERDMFQHVHKEDNVLFPRAARLEAELAERALA